MELLPKLLAAADMCESSEEINLDEISFLLRYAAEEVGCHEETKSEHARLVENLRKRVIARCELLHRPESEMESAKTGKLAILEKLDDELSNELKNRYEIEESESEKKQELSAEMTQKFRSGRE